MTNSFPAVYILSVPGFDKPSNNGNPINRTASPAYKVGPLGAYYLDSANNPLLIDHGSIFANLVGLYNYTVMTNFDSGLQRTEGCSTVDVGSHYVALNAANSPIDSDGDGISDYLECNISFATQ